MQKIIINLPTPYLPQSPTPTFPLSPCSPSSAITHKAKGHARSRMIVLRVQVPPSPRPGAAARLVRRRHRVAAVHRPQDAHVEGVPADARALAGRVRPAGCHRALSKLECETSEMYPLALLAEHGCRACPLPPLGAPPPLFRSACPASGSWRGRCIRRYEQGRK